MKNHSGKKIRSRSMKKRMTAIICVVFAILMVLTTVSGAVVTIFV